MVTGYKLALFSLLVNELAHKEDNRLSLNLHTHFCKFLDGKKHKLTYASNQNNQFIGAVRGNGQAKCA